MPLWPPLPLLALLSSSSGVPWMPLPCGRSSQPAQLLRVSRMFLVARFSSLGPSSLLEEMPLSGNPALRLWVLFWSVSFFVLLSPLVCIRFCYIVNVENRFCTLLRIYLSEPGVFRLLLLLFFMLLPHGSHTWASCGMFVSSLSVLPSLLFIKKNIFESCVSALTPCVQSCICLRGGGSHNNKLSLI